MTCLCTLFQIDKGHAQCLVDGMDLSFNWRTLTPLPLWREMMILSFHPVVIFPKWMLSSITSLICWAPSTPEAFSISATIMDVPAALPLVTWVFGSEHPILGITNTASPSGLLCSDGIDPWYSQRFNHLPILMVPRFSEPNLSFFECLHNLPRRWDPAARTHEPCKPR